MHSPKDLAIAVASEINAMPSREAEQYFTTKSRTEERDLGNLPELLEYADLIWEICKFYWKLSKQSETSSGKKRKITLDHFQKVVANDPKSIIRIVDAICTIFDGD